MRAANLFAQIPPPAAEEHFETLFTRPGLRIERILSHRHASPPGFWYDQPADEWVMLARGSAELEFDDGQDRKYDCDHTHNNDWCPDAFSCADDASEGIYGIGERYPCMNLRYECR